MIIGADGVQWIVNCHSDSVISEPVADKGERDGNFAHIIYGRSLEMRLEVALAAEGFLAALALELVRVHVEVVCKDQISF